MLVPAADRRLAGGKVEPHVGAIEGHTNEGSVALGDNAVDVACHGAIAANQKKTHASIANSGDPPSLLSRPRDPLAERIGVVGGQQVGPNSNRWRASHSDTNARSVDVIYLPDRCHAGVITDTHNDVNGQL